MKERISITIDEETVRKLNFLIKSKKYRNRSHAVEIAIEKLVKDEQDEKDKKKKD
ncbi:ribbon-helix-helix protein, CopG family [Candidatus Woesearchaeota archaeon]|nr:ribbon-helix-helix protein, CopG family [Candidatus Woesearchaeota archaeon]